MAKPTERALKRKPQAVILLTTLVKDVPNVPDTQGGREFEWFETDKGRDEFWEQNRTFHEEDTKSHGDMAYLMVEVTDTAADPMTLGKSEVWPVSDATTKWLESIRDDITASFTPVKATTSTETDGGKKTVRPRKKSTAAAAVKKDDGDDKAARLKERLAEKKADVKSETGDPAPKPRPPAKKAAAKKVAESKDTEIVVKKAAVDA